MVLFTLVLRIRDGKVLAPSVSGLFHRECVVRCVPRQVVALAFQHESEPRGFSQLGCVKRCVWTQEASLRLRRADVAWWLNFAHLSCSLFPPGLAHPFRSRRPRTEKKRRKHTWLFQQQAP